MKFTVESLLNMDCVKDLKLVGGKDGIYREITNAIALDNPDIVKWLHQGEILLTTGYAFRNDPDLQIKIVQQMSDAKCSAIAIKVKRYLNEIPLAMIEEVNKYNIPLIEIPYHYTLSQLNIVICREILNNQAGLLKKSEDIHKSLTEIALSGGGLKKITQQMFNLIGNPLIALDNEWNLLTYSEDNKGNFPLENFINIASNRETLSLEFIKEIVETKKISKLIKKKCTFNNYKIISIIKPIIGNGQNYGYFIIIEAVRELNSIDYIALEHAATIAALERIKEKEINETKYRVRADFFNDLLECRFKSASEVNSLVELHGLDISKKYSCMVIKINQANYLKKENVYSTKDELFKIGKKVNYLVEQIGYKEQRNFISFFRGNKAVMFIPINNTSDSIETKITCKCIAKNLHMKLCNQIPGIDISIGIGQPYKNVLDLNKSFNEAIETIEILKKISSKEIIGYFEDFMVYHLINSSISKSHLENFYNSTIAKLVRFDEENNTNLTDTLETYFYYQRNASKAAKQMYIHRNTLIYRMEKIKSILGSDLDDAEDILKIQLGLKAKDLIATTK